jgi:sugar lactone lactonase YvrE
VCARDSGGRCAPLSNRFFAPYLINPWAVVLKSDNSRIVLDPQNGYAFLKQGSDGVYTASMGSVHNHVEYSKFLAIDKNLNRLIISHPSDEYGGAQSVRVSDIEASLTGLVDYGTAGTGNGQFNTPAGVAVDPESRIYAVDNGNNRIQILTSAGSYICQFGSSGSSNGQFSNAQGIAVDANHKIYVCDKGNKRVQILQFNPSTSSISFVGTLTGKTLNGPCGVTVSPFGSILVTDQTANTVEAYSSYGNWLASFTTASSPYSGTLSGPTGIVVDGNGNTIVCDTVKKRVVTVAIPQPTTVNQARAKVDNTVVELDGATVTAKFSGYFYIQDQGHIPGIRVVAATTVSVGQRVDVLGPVKTVNAEREIQATKVVAHVTNPTPPTPVYMNLGKLVGGGTGVIPGLSGGAGLNNEGLLVKVSGKTSGRNTGNSEFYLDDGSGMQVRIYAPGLTIPADGVFITVTGVSGAEIVNSVTNRVVRARSIF